MVAYGPARMREKSATSSPSSGPGEPPFMGYAPSFCTATPSLRYSL